MITEQFLRYIRFMRNLALKFGFKFAYSSEKVNILPLPACPSITLRKILLKAKFYLILQQDVPQLINEKRTCLVLWYEKYKGDKEFHVKPNFEAKYLISLIYLRNSLVLKSKLWISSWKLPTSQFFRSIMASVVNQIQCKT